MDCFSSRLLSPRFRWNVRANNALDARSQKKPDVLRLTRQMAPFKKRLEPDKFIRTKGDLMPCLRGNFKGSANRKRNMLKSSPVILNLHENDVEGLFEGDRLCRQRKSRIGKRSSILYKSPNFRSNVRRSPRSTGSSISHGLFHSGTFEKRPLCGWNHDLMSQSSKNYSGITSQQGTRLYPRDENHPTARLLYNSERDSDYSKFFADQCVVGNALHGSFKEMGVATTHHARTPDHNYKFFPLLQDDDHFYKPSSLQKYFSPSSPKKEGAAWKSTVIRKLFPEKRAKNRSSPSRTTSAGPSIQSRSRLSSVYNKSYLSEAPSTFKKQNRPPTYRPSTARRLDPCKRSTFEYFMKKLSQLSTNVQIPYEHVYPRKWELTKEAREEYADKIANVFEHNLRKFAKCKRLPKKTERKTSPKMPKWKY